MSLVLIREWLWAPGGDVTSLTHDVKQTYASLCALSFLLSIPWGIWFIFVSYILVYLRRRQIQMFIKINNPIKLVKFNPTLDWVSRILVNVGPGIMVAEKNERYLKILFMISWYTLCLGLLPSCVCQSRCRALSCSRSGDHILFVKHSELFTGILRYLSLVGVRPSFGICQ